MTLIASKSRKSTSIGVYLNPVEFVRDLWSHRELIRQLAAREVDAKYRGSIGGLLWAVLQPLLMLVVYTFVFSVVFEARWGNGTDGDGSQVEFALAMYSGLVFFNLFSECVSRAPRSIISQVNYVKKVVFPLQTIPISATASVLYLATINIGILLASILVLKQSLPITVVCLPLVLIPAVMLSLGLSYLLSSLGVFLRDVEHVVVIVVQVLFFLTPLFYPAEVVPEPFQSVIRLNPLGTIIEAGRDALLWGRWPDWQWLAAAWLISALVLQLGYAWFMKTRKGFADVL